jgi:hypothetical protein
VGGWPYRPPFPSFAVLMAIFLLFWKGTFHIVFMAISNSSLISD